MRYNLRSRFRNVSRLIYSNFVQGGGVDEESDGSDDDYVMDEDDDEDDEDTDMRRDDFRQQRVLTRNQFEHLRHLLGLASAMEESDGEEEADDDGPSS